MKGEPKEGLEERGKGSKWSKGKKWMSGKRGGKEGKQKGDEDMNGKRKDR